MLVFIEQTKITFEGKNDAKTPKTPSNLKNEGVFSILS